MTVASQKEAYLQALREDNHSRALSMLRLGFDPTIGDPCPSSFEEYRRKIFCRFFNPSHLDLLKVAEEEHQEFSDQFMAAYLMQADYYSLDVRQFNHIINRASKSNFIDLYQQAEKEKVFALQTHRMGGLAAVHRLLDLFGYHLNDHLQSRGKTVFGQISYAFGVAYDDHKFVSLFVKLLDAGADPYVAPSGGESAIEIAKNRSEKCGALIESILLRRSMLDIHKVDALPGIAMNL